MPVFQSAVKKGHALWVPAESVISAETGPGGLSTVLTLVPLPGMAGIRTCEVEGRIETVGAALDAALAKYPPIVKPLVEAA